jgi:hypothetical protein
MACMGFFRCNGCQHNKLLLMASVLDGALLYPESPACGLQMFRSVPLAPDWGSHSCFELSLQRV